MDIICDNWNQLQDKISGCKSLCDKVVTYFIERTKNELNSCKYNMYGTVPFSMIQQNLCPLIVDNVPVDIEGLTRKNRAAAHMLGDVLGLYHKSYNKENNRVIRFTKPEGWNMVLNRDYLKKYLNKCEEECENCGVKCDKSTLYICVFGAGPACEK